VIGLAVEAYCSGRRDAMAARPMQRPARKDSPGAFSDAIMFYTLGYKDEIARMAAEKRLAQLELDLHVENREGA